MGVWSAGRLWHPPRKNYLVQRCAPSVTGLVARCVGCWASRFWKTLDTVPLRGLVWNNAHMSTDDLPASVLLNPDPGVTEGRHDWLTCDGGRPRHCYAGDRPIGNFP